MMKEKEFDALKERKAIVEWIRAWFEANGKGAGAVLGISGGKDSSVVAALLAEALGPERVTGVLRPRGVQPDIEDAKEVVRALGIRSMEVNIGAAADEMCRCIRAAVNPLTGEPVEAQHAMSEDAKINLPPRLRMAVVYAVAQSLPGGGRVANTCNASEDYVGYSTKYGDSAGDFAPIADLTVNEVLQIGATFENLPQRLVKKAPSDGLCGLTDEDRFGFTYAVLDRYIRTGICEDKEVKAKIDRMHVANEHKLKVIPKYERING